MYSTEHLTEQCTNSAFLLFEKILISNLIKELSEEVLVKTIMHNRIHITRQMRVKLSLG